MKVGLALPSFVDDPEIPIRVARVADEAGLDGVFVYDHLFRVGRDGTRRPALECCTLLAALAVETRRVVLGTLVLRATLRAPAAAAVALETVRRIAGDRLVVGVGAGDAESAVEMEEFGLRFGTLPERVGAVVATCDALRERGLRVWVGGSARHLGSVAVGHADGWNRWGVDVSRFAAERDALGTRPPGFTLSWGGLVVLAPTVAAAREKADRLGAGPGVLVGDPPTVAEGLRAYAAAGAAWCILGPLDSSDPANAALASEVATHLGAPPREAV